MKTSHFFVWSFYLLLELLLALPHYHPNQLESWLLYSFSMVPSIILASYILHTKILPTYLENSNTLNFSLKILVLLGFLFGYRYAVHVGLFNLSTEEWVYLPMQKMLKGFVRDTSLMATFTSVFVLIDWKTNRVKVKELESQLTTYHNALLTKQLQPHFLFNAFNNIQSLIISDPKKGAEALMTLSDLLEHVVYMDIKKKVTLKKEKIAIEKLVELQRLKYGDRLHYSFEGDKLAIEIPPLLLLTLIENAFKHGAIFQNKFVLSIKVHSNKELIITVTNTINHNTKESDNRSSHGLEFLEGLLKVHYPNMPIEMKSLEKHNMYSITIKIGEQWSGR